MLIKKVMWHNLVWLVSLFKQSVFKVTSRIVENKK